jgi:hypothetical protein
MEFTNFKKEIQTLNYAELNYLISDIMLEIKKRSYNEGMVKAMTSFGSSTEAESPTKTDQQLRDEIVEKAKADIERLLSSQRAKSSFVINKEKRTIVALVPDAFRYPIKIRSRGIAKCDPSDCFNVHIGKAIALRRALGLEVPTEYFNAPQPTEVRVGDVITFAPTDEWHRKLNYRVDSLYPKNGEKNLTVIFDITGEEPIIERAQVDFSDRVNSLVIIDDSREGVTE